MQRFIYDTLGCFICCYQWYVEDFNVLGVSRCVVVQVLTYNQRGLVEGCELIVRVCKMLYGYELIDGIITI